MSNFGNTKHAATTPEAINAAVQWLRGVRPSSVPGKAPTASRVQRAVNYAKPAVNAAADLRSDYGLVRDALNKVVPGLGTHMSKRLRAGGHRAADSLSELAEAHGPHLREMAADTLSRGADALRNRIPGLARAPEPPPPVAPAPWYHDKPVAIGTGLGVASLGTLLGLHMMNRPSATKRDDEDYGGTHMHGYDGGTALHKISAALDLIADEIDARPVLSDVSEEKTASAPDVFSDFMNFYKQQVGEDAPAALVEKLAQDADEETVAALEKLVKRAALERPNPLGEPSEGGGYREPPSTRGDAAKMAWEQFEETLLNYEGA